MKTIKDLRAEHQRTLGAINEIEKAAKDANRDSLTPEEDQQVEALLRTAEDLAVQIERAERIQSQELIATRQAARVVEVVDNRSTSNVLANIVRSLVGGKTHMMHPSRYAEDVLHDSMVAKALSVGTASAGGYTVPTEVSGDVFAALKAASVVRRAGAQVIQLPSGKATLSRINTAAAANWIGENTNVVKTEPVFGPINLSFKKLAAIVPISNDLMRYSNASVDQLVQNDIVTSLAAASDIAYIRGASGGDNPTGIATQVASGQKAAMTASPDLQKVRSDLLKCIQRVVSQNVVLVNPAWILSPRTYFYLRAIQTTTGALAFPEMEQNRLLGYPVFMSTQIPENLGAGTNETEVYFVEMSHCIIGEAMGLSIDLSNTAAYHDGSNVVSAFSLDQTVIRVIEETDFALRYDKSAAMITGVTWS